MTVAILTSSSQIKQCPDGNTFKAVNRWKSSGQNPDCMEGGPRFTEFCHPLAGIFMEKNHPIGKKIKKRFRPDRLSQTFQLVGSVNLSVNCSSMFHAKRKGQNRWIPKALANCLPRNSTASYLFLPGWARVILLHVWSVPGVREMVDPCLITRNASTRRVVPLYCLTRQEATIYHNTGSILDAIFVMFVNLYVRSKVCRKNWSFIKIRQEWRVLYMTTNINYLSYLDRFFLEWEMFRTKFVVKT